MSVPCSVNWYWLLAKRLPIRTGGGFCRNTRIPGTAPSLGPSSRITWSAERRRCERGLRRMNSRPWFPTLAPPPPTEDMNPSMFRSFWTMAATWRWRRTRASNDVPSAVSVVPVI